MTDEQIEQAAIDKFRELSTSMNNPPMFWWVEGFKAGIKYFDQKQDQFVKELASMIDSEMDEQA
jgi:hypothetical protein